MKTHDKMNVLLKYVLGMKIAQGDLVRLHALSDHALDYNHRLYIKSNKAFAIGIVTKRTRLGKCNVSFSEFSIEGIDASDLVKIK